jgi:hypothetical protein
MGKEPKMIHCPKCNYGWNPDTATICVQCKSPLASAAQPLRSDTLSEDLPQSDSSRRPTVAEGVSVAVPPVSRPSDPSVAPPPPPRWNDSAPSSSPIPSDPGLRRRTVFAGTPATPETQPPPPASSLVNSGSRRQQTVAVDPARKIVGVLITYSWQEQGQVFPILEGRNLIGKDPAQCDICIPQDATLSAVNTFITYRKHFLIGDKVSMSGTDVDGEPIETEFVPLRNYAKIRTGSTYWTFVSIQPPSQSSADDSQG